MMLAVKRAEAAANDPLLIVFQRLYSFLGLLQLTLLFYPSWLLYFYDRTEASPFSGLYF